MISEAAVITKLVARARSVSLAAHAHRNMPQRAVVHIQRARPRDLAGIEIQLVAEE